MKERGLVSSRNVRFIEKCLAEKRRERSSLQRPRAGSARGASEFSANLGDPSRIATRQFTFREKRDAKDRSARNSDNFGEMATAGRMLPDNCR